MVHMPKVARSARKAMAEDRPIDEVGLLAAGTVALGT